MLAVAESVYASVMNESVPADFMSYDYFRKCLLDLDLTSSPGYPYMREASTIRKWLGADGFGNFHEVQVSRLWHDVQSVMAGCYEHIFRAFVKDEPHKAAKANKGTWRLIIASSLPVQMVWRMLFKHQNDALNSGPYECPSKHGLVFCYGGWRRFLAMVKTQQLFISRDISAWDVNAPGWALNLVGKLRERWPGVTSTWIRLKDQLYKDAYADSKILFSNGIVVEQHFSGFMKSGLFNTISDNSIALVMMHVLACLRSGLVMGKYAATGDDFMQSVISDHYIDCLEASGCRVKEVLHHVEFMGTDYRKGVPEPMYFQKHLVAYATKIEEREQVLDAYCRLYCYSDKFDFWKRVAQRGDYPTRTLAYYQFWYSSPLAKVMKSLW